MTVTVEGAPATGAAKVTAYVGDPTGVVSADVASVALYPVDALSGFVTPVIVSVTWAPSPIVLCESDTTT